MKISLMTLTMFLRAIFKFQLDHDRADLLELYEEIFQMAKTAGYTSLDICSMETMLITVEHIEMLMQKYDMSISSYIYLDQCNSPAEGIQQAIETAKRLGAGVLMLAPQWTDNLNGLDREAIHNFLVQRWTEGVAKAIAQGLKVVVEDTPDLKFHLCKAEDVQALLERIPGVQMVYDSGNMVLVNEDPVSYCEKFADKIGYVHLKDMRIAIPGEPYADTAADGRLMKGAPSGTGLIDLKAVVAKLKEIGYTGNMVVEFYAKPDGDFQASLCESFAYISNL